MRKIILYLFIIVNIVLVQHEMEKIKNDLSMN